MLTILLVDDMKHFLNLERSFLRRSDCRILTATTGLEAVKVARLENPDIILLDVEMPEMNGIEATRILKSLPGTKKIPVVIITSLNVREEAMGAGADDYHQKPIDEMIFLSLVQKHVNLPIRKEPRVAMDIPTFFIFNEQKWPGVVKDLSSTGCMVDSSVTPPVGELIRVDFTLPLDGDSKAILQDSYVVRMTERGFGCSFHDVSTGIQIYLKEFLMSHAAEGGGA